MSYAFMLAAVQKARIGPLTCTPPAYVQRPFAYCPNPYPTLPYPGLLCVYSVFGETTGCAVGSPFPLSMSSEGLGGAGAATNNKKGHACTLRLVLICIYLSFFFSFGHPLLTTFPLDSTQPRLCLQLNECAAILSADGRV